MAKNPSPSELDAQHIFRRSFDDATDRLRVDSTVSGTFTGELSMEIDAADGDSAVAVGTENGAVGGTQHALKVGADLNLRTKDEAANTSLTSIDAKLPVLLSSAPASDTGQSAIAVRIISQLGAGSGGGSSGGLTDTELRATAVPVSGTVTASDGGGSLTVDGSVSVSNFPATQAVSGTVTANAGTGTMAVSGPLTDTQLRATAVPVSGSFFQATQPVSGSVSVSNFPATQAISATSLPLPSGAATSALQTQPGVDIGDVTINNAAGVSAVNIQDGGNSITVDGVFYQTTQPVSIAATVAVSGPVTDAEIRATPLPVSGTVTSNAGTGTMAVSAASLPLPSGAATSTLQTTGNTSVGSIDTKTPALGQALAAASVPIVLTAAQLSTLTPLSSVTVSGTVTANAGTGTMAVSGPLTDTQIRATALPVSGTVSVTGVATETTLSAMNTKVPALGQALAAASTPVVLTAAQITTLTPVSTVTANIGTSGSLALDATLTGGTAKAVVRGGAKGSTAAADVTSTSQSVDRNALDVQIRTSTGVVVDTFGGGTQFADGVARGTATGTLLMVDDGTNIQSALGTTAGVLKVDLSATTANATAIKVDGSAVTQPVSGTVAVTGVATETTLAAMSAKLPTALGTKTIANSMAVNIASDQTVPVSGSVTANAGTNLNTSALALDATLTGGTQKAIVRGGAKGATTAADITSTSQSVDRNAMDVQIRTSAGVVVDTFGGGTQFADGAARGTATGTLLMVDDGTNIQSAIGTTAGVLKIDLSATTANATAVKVDGSAVTQPVSGTFFQATQPVSNVSLPLPTGASTETTLAAMSAKLPATLGTKTIANAMAVSMASDQVLTIQGNQPARTTGSITTSTTTVGPMTVSNLNIATVSVSGTYAGVTFLFEASDDGTNYYSVLGVRNDLGVIESGATLLTNTIRSWDIAIGGFTNFRVRTTAWTSGTAAVGIIAQSFAYEPTPSVTLSPIKPAYSSSTAAFAAAATPTDLFRISGSTSNKVVKVLRIEVSCTQTTAGINTFFLAKRTVANTAGTVVAATIVPHDTAFVASTVTCSAYTANPSALGASAGNIRTSRILCPAVTSAANPTFVWDFESGTTAVPPSLRSAADGLSLNFGGAALPAGLSVTVSVTWTEE